jgi:hypothetical protein
MRHRPPRRSLIATIPSVFLLACGAEDGPVRESIRFIDRPVGASERDSGSAATAADPSRDGGAAAALPSNPPIGSTPTVVGRDASGFAQIDGKSRFLKLVYDATNNGASYASVTVPARHFENYAWDVVLNYFLGSNDNAIKAAAALRPYGTYTVAIGNAVTHNPVAPGANLQLVDDASFRTKWASTPGAIAAYLADEPEDSIQSNVIQWHGTYKSGMPSIATLSILLQTGFGQAHDWASKDTGDWLGIDPYPYLGLESYPLKATPQASAPSTYGWSLDYVAEGAAHLTKWTRQYAKTAIVVNQLFKGFWGAERLPNRTELWAQAVMPIVEGANGVGWWAFGSSYDGALHSSAVSETERVPVETELGTITKLLASLDAVITSSPAPTKLVYNSTAHPSGDPIQWRLEALDDYLTRWPAGYDKPFYQLYSDATTWWGAERAALVSGDSSKSYMLDQASYVRTRVFEAPDGTGYVFAYNHRPTAYPSVTLRWYRNASSVQDLANGQTVPVGADGVSFSAGFGGSSTKREDGLPTARIFKVVH